MDDKTAELRDIFVDATGSETVTERQSEGRGSLVSDGDTAAVDVRLRELVAEMRERFEFRTDLDDDDLLAVVRGFHDAATDEALAADLGVDAAVVAAARHDLHLVRAAERDPPFAFADLRRLIAADVDDEVAAAELGTDPETVRRYRSVVRAEARSVRASDRFRDAFAELLTDDHLRGRHARTAREDGLREAIEDLEVDVSL